MNGNDWDDESYGQDADGTLGAYGYAAPYRTMPHYPAAVPTSGLPQYSVGDRAREAGVAAVKAVWSQAPTLIPLLAVLCYGIGRLAVDGFYAQLNTSAEAAGLGYSSILEPAVILTTFFIAIGTAIAMLLDVFKVIGAWVFRQRYRVLWLVGFVGLAGGSVAAVIAGIARADLIIDAIVSSAGSLPALRTLIDKFGSARDRRIGEERARTDRSLEYSVPTRRRPISKTSVSVIIALGFLICVFFGAHELGTDAGGQAADGQSVDMSLFGFDIPSITATVVSIRPIGSSLALKRLAENRCWLQIGVNSDTILLYNPVNKSTATVPSDQVIVVSSKRSCPKLSTLRRAHFAQF